MMTKTTPAHGLPDHWEHAGKQCQLRLGNPLIPYKLTHLPPVHAAMFHTLLASQPPLNNLLTLTTPLPPEHFDILLDSTCVIRHPSGQTTYHRIVERVEFSRQGDPIALRLAPEVIAVCVPPPTAP